MPRKLCCGGVNAAKANTCGVNTTILRYKTALSASLFQIQIKMYDFETPIWN